MLNEKQKQQLCLKCMGCCKILTVPLEGDCDEARKFYTFRGCTVEPILGDRIGVIIPFTCPHLTNQGCDIYHERPFSCKHYDGTKDPLMKDICLWTEKKQII